jgi:hypothetical protein
MTDEAFDKRQNRVFDDTLALLMIHSFQTFLPDFVQSLPYCSLLLKAANCYGMGWLNTVVVIPIVVLEMYGLAVPESVGVEASCRTEEKAAGLDQDVVVYCNRPAVIIVYRLVKEGKEEEEKEGQKKVCHTIWSVEYSLGCLVSWAYVLSC